MKGGWLVLGELEGAQLEPEPLGAAWHCRLQDLQCGPEAVRLTVGLVPRGQEKEAGGRWRRGACILAAGVPRRSRGCHGRELRGLLGKEVVVLKRVGVKGLPGGCGWVPCPEPPPSRAAHRGGATLSSHRGCRSPAGRFTTRGGRAEMDGSASSSAVGRNRWSSAQESRRHRTGECHRWQTWRTTPTPVPDRRWTSGAQARAACPGCGWVVGVSGCGLWAAALGSPARALVGKEGRRVGNFLGNVLSAKGPYASPHGVLKACL